MKILEDLFKGPGNEAWDIGRLGAGFGMFVLLPGALVWKAYSGQDVSLAELGGAYAAVSLAAGGLIKLKDDARTTAVSAVVKDEALAAKTEIAVEAAK